MIINMKLRGFDLTKAQIGWVCDTCFMISTSRQASNEEHVIRSYGKTLLGAIVRGYLDAKKEHARLAASTLERATKGWR